MANRRANLLVKGLSALLAKLVARYQAVVDGSANTGSVGARLALGFKQAGKADACSWKFGAWRDIVIMQKMLGLVDTRPPDDIPH